MPADDSQLLNAPVSADNSEYLDCALNARLSSKCGVARNHSIQNLGFLHIAADSDLGGSECFGGFGRLSLFRLRFSSRRNGRYSN